MTNPKSLTEQLEELQTALEASSYRDICPALESQDLYETYRHLFSPKAQTALADRWTSNIRLKNKTVPDGYVQVFEILHYFTIRVTDESLIPKAAERLATLINEYAEQGYVVGAVAPLGLINLADVGPKDPETLVYSFVGFTPEGSMFLDENSPPEECNEGSLSEILIDHPTPKALPGNIYSRFSVSLELSQVVGAPSPEARLEERKELLLKLLPEGTVFKGMKQLSVYSTFLEHILFFEHPLFPEGTRVELDYARGYWPSSDGQTIKAADIFKGIRYINRHDKEIDLNDIRLV